MTLKSNKKRGPNRKKNVQANRPQPTCAISATSVTPAGDDVSIEFDQPVSLNGIPKYTTNIQSAIPIAAELTSPTTLKLTFNEDVSLAVSVNIPYEEPGVRNGSGGFVTPKSIAA